MVLPRHGISQDDSHALRVKSSGWVTVIIQRLVAGRYGPLLRLVDLFLDAGRDGDPHFGRLEVESTHPAADLAVGLIWCRWIGTEEKLWLPTLSAHLADRVAAAKDVLPKGLYVRRIRQDCAHPNDGYG